MSFIASLVQWLGRLEVSAVFTYIPQNKWRILDYLIAVRFLKKKFEKTLSLPRELQELIVMHMHIISISTLSFTILTDTLILIPKKGLPPVSSFSSPVVGGPHW